MISTDFAVNEFIDDALTSLITLAMPWTWKEGREKTQVRKKLESYFPMSESVFFLSGRSALSLLLSEMELPENSEIIVQGFTCEAVVLPVIENNLKPVYVDIEPMTFSADIKDVISKTSKNTRVIILQHSFGMTPLNRDKVLQYAKQKKILVIEDLAHGFSPSFWQTQKLSDNQVLLLSFGRSKALSSVFGGAIISTNKTIIRKLKEREAVLPDPGYGLMIKLLCYKPLSFFIKKTYNCIGFGKFLHLISKKMGLIAAEISPKEKSGLYDIYLEKKYPNCLAKLLLNQLNKYKKTQIQRNKIAQIYGSRLFHSLPKEAIANLSRFPLLVQNKTSLLKRLSKKNIFLGNWYSQPVAPAPLPLEKVGYRKGSCPVAEHICCHIVNLPILISEKDALLIIDATHTYDY